MYQPRPGPEDMKPGPGGEDESRGEDTRRHSPSSNWCVPERSPRDTNAPCRAASRYDVVAALKRLAARHGAFVSRGDRSGTHQFELGLWRRVSSPRDSSSPPGPGFMSSGPGRGWYIESGQGMAATLRMADEKR